MLRITYNPTRRSLTPAIMADIMDRAYENFPEGRDVMKLAAEYIFNTPYDHVTPAQRVAAKREAYWLLYATPGYGIPSRPLQQIPRNEVSDRLFKDKSQVVRNWPIQAESARLLGVDPARDRDWTGVTVLSNSEVTKSLCDSLKRMSDQFQVATVSARDIKRSWDDLNRLKKEHLDQIAGTVTGRLSSREAHISSPPRSGKMLPELGMDFTGLENLIVDDFLIIGASPSKDDVVMRFGKGAAIRRMIADSMFRSAGMCLTEIDSFGGINRVTRKFPATEYIDHDSGIEKPTKKFAKALQDQRNAKRQNSRNVNPLLAGLMGKLK